MQELIIEAMTKEDLVDIINIESRVFPDPWTYTMFAEQLGLPDLYRLFTVRIAGEMVGYGGLLTIRDEGHITNLAVKLEEQGKGIGKVIVYYLLQLAQKADINSVLLEVRTTNIKAQELYKKFGFEIISVRKNYYGYEEDAFIMTANITDKNALKEKLTQVENNLQYKIDDHFS